MGDAARLGRASRFERGRRRDSRACGMAWHGAPAGRGSPAAVGSGVRAPCESAR
ncbi:hypothetical protein BMA10229_A1824 [Burkholderia mallei NCTC 10229]|uniref:Uncharacterized protein n=1 Tax=Burkholderia mallei (strain NCTC 10229) TaxID=412022 RepID=A2S782_BURM9|nr:hypothetical protein BMA10229_A1824 [Burkholderia mallei NCTC 10229]